MTYHKKSIYPPSKSKNIFTDIRYYFLNNPKCKTLVKFHTKTEKDEYSLRILQRINTSVSNYSILNVHQIGIEAPVSYVFEELMNWNGDSTCWPNNIARVSRVDDNIEEIKLYLFNMRRYPFGFKKRFLGLNYVPFFNLDALRVQRIPYPTDPDNARYLLYKTSGGYPIGVFSMFVRSGIADQNEKEIAQLFLATGFDFYGNKKWSKRHIIYRTWAAVHNRVTRNIMNRLKLLCEWKFETLKHESLNK